MGGAQGRLSVERRCHLHRCRRRRPGPCRLDDDQLLSHRAIGMHANSAAAARLAMPRLGRPPPHPGAAAPLGHRWMLNYVNRWRPYLALLFVDVGARCTWRRAHRQASMRGHLASELHGEPRSKAPRLTACATGLCPQHLRSACRQGRSRQRRAQLAAVGEESLGRRPPRSGNTPSRTRDWG